MNTCKICHLVPDCEGKGARKSGCLSALNCNSQVRTERFLIKSFSRCFIQSIRPGGKRWPVKWWDCNWLTRPLSTKCRHLALFQKKFWRRGRTKNHKYICCPKLQT